MQYTYINLMRESDESVFLDSRPIESHVLRIIAKRARRTPCTLTGLSISEAMMGDYAAIGLSRQQYRTAISNLRKWNFITTRVTTKGTIAKLMDSMVYDINAIEGNHQNNQQPAIETTSNQPSGNHQVTTNKNDNKDKKEKKVRNKELDYSCWPSLPSDQVLKDWLTHRTAVKAKVSQTVINRLATEFIKAGEMGLSVDDCLSETVTRGWKGFKADWMTNSQNRSRTGQPDTQREQEINDWINGKTPSMFDQPEKTIEGEVVSRG